MNSKFQILTIVSLALLSVSAFAGGDKAGNGGATQVCYTPKGEIRDVKSYDLVEGVYRYGYAIDLGDSRSEKEIETELWARVREAVPAFEPVLTSALKKVDAAWNLGALSIERVNDAHPILYQEGCKYVQIANWDDVTGKLFVSESLYSRLSAQSRVALRWHEAIYLIERQLDYVTNSDDARRENATFFQANLDEIRKYTPFRQNVGVYPFYDATGLPDFVGYVNWPTSADYVDANRFTIVVELVDGTGSVQFPNASLDLHKLNGYYGNSLSAKTPRYSAPIFKSLFPLAGNLYLPFHNYGPSDVRVRITLTSLASGFQVTDERKVLAGLDASFLVRW